MSEKRLILILGDQLSQEISSLKDADPSRDVIVMGEVASETAYVRHHKKKIAFIFSAMRHFAEALREAGHSVAYQKLDDENAVDSFTELVARARNEYEPERIVVTEPGEHRVRAEIEKWADRFETPVDILEDGRFICSHTEFKNWADGRKTLRMEYFYRQMRKKTGLLMDDGEPAGGRWNFDSENRKSLKKGVSCPRPREVKTDEITKDVLRLVEDRFADHFGDLAPFWFATTRADALEALDHFIEHALPNFGDYQDAMVQDEKFLFHAVLSAYINIGLLDPLEVCRRAEDAWRSGDAPLNAVEGFIRQIIGWREYMRGIYWRADASYTEQNFFGADRSLPEFYWTGETDMACVSAVVRQTREEAYAHHIQRLMVTGTFALLAGVDPRAVHEWYLAVYADAFEWVEAPNVIGMSQFADGGALGSKPYAASGAYINRMSDYCRSCSYKVSKKTESDACPFNALYWDFLARNEDRLNDNPRLGHPYRNWRKMDADKKRSYRARAQAILKKLDDGARI